MNFIFIIYKTKSYLYKYINEIKENGYDIKKVKFIKNDTALIYLNREKIYNLLDKIGGVI